MFSSDLGSAPTCSSRLRRAGPRGRLSPLALQVTRTMRGESEVGPHVKVSTNITILHTHKGHKQTKKNGGRALRCAHEGRLSISAPPPVPGLPAPFPNFGSFWTRLRERSPPSAPTKSGRECGVWRRVWGVCVGGGYTLTNKGKSPLMLASPLPLASSVGQNGGTSAGACVIDYLHILLAS